MESKSLKSRVAELSATNKQLASEKKALHTQLSESQTEVKTLTAKLAATRASSANPEPKVPGSAVKAQRAMTAGSSEAAKDSQIRQLKEDLYSDLTGLIVRAVKRGEDEDIYDCIQTGRNGSKSSPWVRCDSSLTFVKRCISILPSLRTIIRPARVMRRLNSRIRLYLTRTGIVTSWTSFQIT